MKPMEYAIKGVVLDAYDLVAINEYYRVACIAEYIHNNYRVDEKTAMKLGADVIWMMDKYGYSEADAISTTAQDKHLKKRS